MRRDGLLKALARLSVETGSLACLGCGHEHNCAIHGCAILRAARETILRPVSREQAKQEWPPCSQCKPLIDMGMECFSVRTDDGREFDVNYCTKCGRPLSEIGWDDWAKRVEALKDGKGD